MQTHIIKTFYIQLTVEDSVMKIQLKNDVLSTPNESNLCLWTVRNVFWSCNNLCGQQDYVHFTGAFFPFSNHIVLGLFVPRVIVYFVGELFLRA
jgi:hypothetical protein